MRWNRLSSVLAAAALLLMISGCVQPGQLWLDDSAVVDYIN